MAKYKAVWNILTPQGIKTPGVEFDLDASEAEALPPGSVEQIETSTEVLAADPPPKSPAKGSKANPSKPELASTGGASE